MDFCFQKVQGVDKLLYLKKDSIQRLIKGSSNGKAVLGMFVSSADIPLFGIHPLNKRSVTFAYRSRNISAVDTASSAVVLTESYRHVLEHEVNKF